MKKKAENGGETDRPTIRFFSRDGPYSFQIYPTTEGTINYRIRRVWYFMIRVRFILSIIFMNRALSLVIYITRVICELLHE